MASDTLKVAPMNEDDDYSDPSITPQMNLHSSTLPPLSTASISKMNMSMRGWSGALPKEIQSFPTLEDVRGAICRMQCPERNKETFDDLPLFVSPCILSTPVCIMQECDNKVVQKSQFQIFLTLKL